MKDTRTLSRKCTPLRRVLCAAGLVVFRAFRLGIVCICMLPGKKQ